MRFKQLDLNLLVALDHMMNLRSISRAAEQMNMSQSAMSNALTRLRDYFGDPLLVQVGRRMELTPKAEAMRNAIRDVLVRVDAAIATDLSFEPRQSSREFSILLSDFTMTVLMPHVIQLAYEASPTIRFRLLPQQMYPYLEIDRGEADLLVAPGMFSSREHPSEPLFDDDYCCLVWRDGKYGGQDAFEERDYLEAGHASHAADHRRAFLRGPVSRTTRDFPSHRGDELYIHVPSQLIVGTDRIATVHSLIAAMRCNRYRSRGIDCPSLAELDEHLQWHEHRSRDPGIVWLRGIFRRRRGTTGRRSASACIDAMRAALSLSMHTIQQFDFANASPTARPPFEGGVQ